MERLTKKSDQKGRGYVSAIGSGAGTWNRIITRLAEYENTGLLPEEMQKRAKEFPDVVYEHDGRFVLVTDRLPIYYGCPPGVHHVKGCDDMTCEECWMQWFRDSWERRWGKTSAEKDGAKEVQNHA